jgi:hypothetical protein
MILINFVLKIKSSWPPCDALDIKVQNLVHKQDVCTIQKKQQGNSTYQF